MSFNKSEAVRNAEKFLAQGKIRQAVNEYQEIVKRDPDDITNLNILGDLLIKANQTDEALKCFRRVAEHYNQKGFPQKAIAVYNKIFRHRPDCTDTLEKLAELNRAKGAVAEARTQYKKLAEFYDKLGDTDNRIKVWRALTELDKQNTDICLKLGELCRKHSRSKESADAFAEAGDRLFSKNDLDKSLEAYTTALEQDPEHIKGFQGFVRIALVRGTYMDAVDKLEEILNDHPENADLRELLAECYLEMGEVFQAEDILMGLVTQDSSRYKQLLRILKKHLMNGEVKSAIRILSMTADYLLSDDSPDLLLEWTNAILEREPSNLDAMRLQARYYTSKGDVLSATSILDQISVMATKSVAESAPTFHATASFELPNADSSPSIEEGPKGLEMFSPEMPDYSYENQSETLDEIGFGEAGIDEHNAEESGDYFPETAKEFIPVAQAREASADAIDAGDEDLDISTSADSANPVWGEVEGNAPEFRSEEHSETAYSETDTFEEETARLDAPSHALEDSAQAPVYDETGQDQNGFEIVAITHEAVGGGRRRRSFHEQEEALTAAGSEPISIDAADENESEIKEREAFDLVPEDDSIEVIKGEFLHASAAASEIDFHPATGADEMCKTASIEDGTQAPAEFEFGSIADFTPIEFSDVEDEGVRPESEFEFNGYAVEPVDEVTSFDEIQEEEVASCVAETVSSFHGVTETDDFRSESDVEDQVETGNELSYERFVTEEWSSSMHVSEEHSVDPVEFESADAREVASEAEIATPSDNVFVPRIDFDFGDLAEFAEHEETTVEAASAEEFQVLSPTVEELSAPAYELKVADSSADFDIEPQSNNVFDSADDFTEEDAPSYASFDSCGIEDSSEESEYCLTESEHAPVRESVSMAELSAADEYMPSVDVSAGPEYLSTHSDEMADSTKSTDASIAVAEELGEVAEQFIAPLEVTTNSFETRIDQLVAEMNLNITWTEPVSVDDGAEAETEVSGSAPHELTGPMVERLDHTGAGYLVPSNGEQSLDSEMPSDFVAACEAEEFVEFPVLEEAAYPKSNLIVSQGSDAKTVPSETHREDDSNIHSREGRLASLLDTVDFFIGEGFFEVAKQTFDAMVSEFGHRPQFAELEERLAMFTSHYTEETATPVRMNAKASLLSVTPALYDPDFPELSTLGMYTPEEIKNMEHVVEIDEETIFDYETFFDTATAYREMGLLDYAVREFENALKLVRPDDGTRRFFQCCNMLGHCFMDYGKPDLAVMWFRRAQEVPGLTADEDLALLYEIAKALEAHGKTNEAASLLGQVHATSEAFQEVNQLFMRLAQS